MNKMNKKAQSIFFPLVILALVLAILGLSAAIYSKTTHLEKYNLQ